MTSATFTPASSIPATRTASGRAARAASRPVSTTLRAIRVFGGAAVDVVLLGRYAEEAGVENPRPGRVADPD
ncbi:hypothetical protein [Streptomyces sp. NPDC053755]|uniref:hypothetical protein n=1 Tax=Streptomyces sp. NPDC053755 TaxID=3155815 RepID=UPI0034329891